MSLSESEISQLYQQEDLERIGLPRAKVGLIDDLPDAGQHPNRTIAFGSDGLLYLSVGSTCNACDEPDEEHATILQVQPDGSQRTVYANPC